MSQVAKDKSVGSLPLLPYTSMIISGFFWMMYALLVKQPKLFAADLICMILGSFYFGRFVQFANMDINADPSSQQRLSLTLPGFIWQHVATCVSVILVTLILVGTAPHELAAAVVGNLAVFFDMALFGSPLAAVKNVLMTKSAASIPLPFTLVTVLNCFLWSVTGIFEMKDVNVYFPSLVGLAFGMVQVALKLVYGSRPVPAERAEPLVPAERAELV